MEEGKNHHLFQDSWFQYEDNLKNDERCEESSSASSSIGEDSDASNGSSITSSDTVDDASSSSPSSSLDSSSSSSRALYDLSEIMDQLPIKRGLSQFYQGKSESFTSLSRVTSIDDLVKKAAAVVSPNRRNLKSSKSCGTGLHSYKQYTLPKAIISKKASRGVVSLSSFPSKRGGFMNNSKPPLTPLHQDLEC